MLTAMEGGDIGTVCGFFLDGDGTLLSEGEAGLFEGEVGAGAAGRAGGGLLSL